MVYCLQSDSKGSVLDMHLERYLILSCIILSLASTSTAESTFSFPCDVELSPFLAVSEHKISREINLVEYYREEIDYWDDDILMIESGSLIVLDDQFMIISLRFSEDYDYDAAYAHVPESIMLANLDPNISNDTGTPDWRVTIYPDKNDPYSFHYIGTWNWTMAGFTFYGSYIDQCGDSHECFSFSVSII